jgi:hypothetical protein
MLFFRKLKANDCHHRFYRSLLMASLMILSRLSKQFRWKPVSNSSELLLTGALKYVIETKCLEMEMVTYGALVYWTFPAVSATFFIASATIWMVPMGRVLSAYNTKTLHILDI